MGREIVGHCECPECGQSGAEIKRAKNGLLYRWCPDCSAQYVPRTPAMSDRLGQRAGVAKPADKSTETPVTVTEKKPGQAAPAKRNFDMGL